MRCFNKYNKFISNLSMQSLKVFNIDLTFHQSIKVRHPHHTSLEHVAARDSHRFTIPKLTIMAKYNTTIIPQLVESAYK